MVTLTLRERSRIARESNLKQRVEIALNGP